MLAPRCCRVGHEDGHDRGGALPSPGGHSARVGVPALGSALRWFARRRTAQGCATCACELSWGTCEQIASRQAQPPAWGPHRPARALLCKRPVSYHAFAPPWRGHDEWDDETAIDLASPEEEAALLEEESPKQDHSTEVQMVPPCACSPYRRDRDHAAGTRKAVTGAAVQGGCAGELAFSSGWPEGTPQMMTVTDCKTARGQVARAGHLPHRLPIH